ncbi:MAG TPA: hypothetical protein VHJ20_21560 [Polyangia bacterium]|nr:hypothetical protein [Polyangia bacterium]
MRGGSRAGAALGLLVAIATSMGSRARAAEAPVADAPPELALTWRAPERCPSAGDVDAQFARLLGGAARAPSGKKIAATAFVREAGTGRWVLDLATDLDGAEGRRTIAGDSCASVASAAALILALMIDPTAAERATEESAPPTPPREPPPKKIEAPPAIEAKPQPATSGDAWPVRPFVRGFGAGVVSLLPSAALGGGVGVGARRGRLAVELTALATQARHADAAGAPGEGGTFHLAIGGARACGALSGHVAGSVGWQLCLGAELERITATGTGVDVVRSANVKMAAGTGGVIATVPLAAHVGISLELDGALRPYHPQFSLDQIGPIYRVPWASAAGALGVVVSL